MEDARGKKTGQAALLDVKVDHSVQDGASHARAVSITCAKRECEKEAHKRSSKGRWPSRDPPGKEYQEGGCAERHASKKLRAVAFRSRPSVA